MKAPAPIFAAVGTWHAVPCIYVPAGMYGQHWIPVIGPRHTDPDIGVHWEHWHIDWRFVGERMFRRASDCPLRSPHGKVVSNDGLGATRSLSGHPVLKRRLCKRAMPDFPQVPKPLWIGMERAQRERCARLKDGHTCPHRGIDLRPFARPDGTAVCPGHGLRWDLRTGQLLPRHDVIEAHHPA